MGYWVIRGGNVEWAQGNVDTDEYADTGTRKWWSRWAPSMCGLLNAKLPVFKKGSWTKKQLRETVDKIRSEISEHDGKWTIEEKKLGSDGLSTCQANLGDGKKHQSLREYKIQINASNPLDYEMEGLSQKALMDVCRVHEQTHALCDISYTANNKNSRLGTWNDADGVYDDNCDAAYAHRKRMESLWETIDKDDYLSEQQKKIMFNRVGYGYGNLIDIDTVVNELCVVATYVDISLFSPSIHALIEFAELNLGYRAIGRDMQTRPKLRVY